MKHFSLISEKYFSPSGTMPEHHTPSSWQDTKLMSKLAEMFTVTDPVMFNYLMVLRAFSRKEKKQIKQHKSSHHMNI